jgi:hypothetical protein
LNDRDHGGFDRPAFCEKQMPIGDNKLEQDGDELIVLAKTGRAEA